MNFRLILREPKILFRMMCHRMQERSYNFSGESLYLCSRCMGIYIGFLANAVVLFLLYGFFNATISFFLAALFIVPMVFDGTTQLFKWRESNNSLRFVTGFISGIGVSYFFYAAYSITFMLNSLSAKVPDVKSFAISSAIMLLLLAVLNKYNNQYNNFLQVFFNFLIILSVVFIVFAAGFLWLYLMWNVIVLLR